jgi:putative transposase
LAHRNTVFAQLLKLIPRHQFEAIAQRHHRGRKLRRMTRYSQWIALASGQLCGRQSLRDIASNLRAQGRRLYHLGIEPVARSSLARVNEKQSYTLYEELFGKLYASCRALAPGHRFRFRNPLYSLDASLIDLSLNIFPWADYNRMKAAVKLHVGLDHSGYLPAFVTVTDARVHDVAVGRTLELRKGSIVVFDKGYLDYRWWKSLGDKGVFFVTRLRTNACYEVVERRRVRKDTGVRADHVVRLTGKSAIEIGVKELRCVLYRDRETGKIYRFVTNCFHLSAETIAAIYKERWQIELFFKWLKQNLKIRSFVGTSKNAILTQIWVALCIYLLIAMIKLKSRLAASMQQLLRFLHVGLFTRQDLLELLRGGPPLPFSNPPCPQLALL